MGQRDARAGAQVAQGFAMDELHHHGKLVLVIKSSMELGDVDVVETGQRLHFAPEPFHHLRRARLVGEQNLHGFAAPGDEVLDFVNHTQAPGAQPRNHFVIPDPLPRLKSHNVPRLDPTPP
jgi:hypothetical protein